MAAPPAAGGAAGASPAAGPAAPAAVAAGTAAAAASEGLAGTGVFESKVWVRRQLTHANHFIRCKSNSVKEVEWRGLNS